MRDVVNINSPGDVGLVPSADQIDVKKLSDGANVQTDTCNAAQKLQRVLVKIVGGCDEYECMHHLRNVWFGNMENKLTKKLNLLLGSDLDKINPRLRVTALVSALI